MHHQQRLLPFLLLDVVSCLQKLLLHQKITTIHHSLLQELFDVKVAAVVMLQQQHQKAPLIIHLILVVRHTSATIA